MKDQADKLRQIIDNLKIKQSVNQTVIVHGAPKRTAKVITVTSGKGGVGKTNVTINLAIALSEMGLKVIILDADFGLANIDVLFGIAPQNTLVDVMNGGKNILEVLSDGPKNIRFISGGSGVEELIKLKKDQLDNFVNNIGFLDKICDIILIDTGAGLSDNVLSFVMASDEVLLVATPEPTSITDAYALIKMVSNRDKDKIIKVIVNRAEDVNEANDILNRLSIVAEKFLSIKLQKLGYILQDEMVMKSVKMQQPFMIGYPRCSASRLVRDISNKLIETGDGPQNTYNPGIRSFVNKLVTFFNP